MKHIALALLAAVAGTATAQNSQSRQVAGGTASATVTVNPRGNVFAVVVSARGPGNCAFSETVTVSSNVAQPINRSCNAGGIFGDVRIGGSIQVTNFRRDAGQAAMSVTVSGSVVDVTVFGDGATLGSANERFDLVVEDPLERARLAERAEAERQARLALEQAEAARRERVAREEAEVQRQAEARRLAQIAAEQAEAERQAEARRNARIAEEQAEAQRKARIAEEQAEAQRLERIAAERRAVSSRADRQRLQGFGTDGRKVRQVTFATGSGEGILHLDGATWNELDGTGRVTFRFRETARDDWSVYLWDDSRNVGLQADLHTRRVNYMAGPGAAYTFLYTMVDAR